jgi:steroid delta-isomerase-like uncharacterized protein
MVGCLDKEAMAELEEFRSQAEVEEQNKEIVRHFIEELNKGNLGIVEEVYAPDYVFFSPSNTPKPKSREEVIEFGKMVLTAFPDANWSIKELFATGDKIIVWNIFSGTNKEEFQGIPPTGNKVEIGSILIFRFQNGRIVEEREEADSLGLMQQLGMELNPKEEEK